MPSIVCLERCIQKLKNFVFKMAYVRCSTWVKLGQPHRIQANEKWKLWYVTYVINTCKEIQDKIVSMIFNNVTKAVIILNLNYWILHGGGFFDAKKESTSVVKSLTLTFLKFWWLKTRKCWSWQIVFWAHVK